MAVKVGDKRSNGGASFTVVAVKKDAVLVKRSEEGKKALAEEAGAHAVSKADFEQWPEE